MTSEIIGRDRPQFVFRLIKQEFLLLVVGFVCFRGGSGADRAHQLGLWSFTKMTNLLLWSFSHTKVNPLL